MQKIDGSQLISEITLDDLQKAVGGSTSFCACVHKLRKMSGFSFVILRTGRYSSIRLFKGQMYRRF